MNVSNNVTTTVVPTKAHVEDGILVLGIVVNAVSVILALLSIVAMATVKGLKRIIKETLISFTFANFLGGVFFMGNFIAWLQNIDFDSNTSTLVGLCCTALLSVNHLACLAFTEYMMVSHQFQKNTKSFCGVLGILWFVAICSCILFLERQVGEIVAISVILLSGIGFTAFYLTLVKKYRDRQANVDKYTANQVQDAADRNQIYFIRVLLCAYFLCSMPWAFKEVYYLREGITSERDTVSAIMDILYSINFYFISTVCIFLRARKSSNNRFK